MKHFKAQYFNKLTTALGLILIVLGAIATHDLFCSHNSRIMPARFFRLSFIGLPVLLVGLATFLRGLGWKDSPSSWRRGLRIGYVMLAIGGFPWLYTWLLVGGRPSNEAAGMLGTIIFIIVGLPGMVLVLTSLALRPKKPSRGKDDA